MMSHRRREGVNETKEVDKRKRNLKVLVTSACAILLLLVGFQVGRATDNAADAKTKDKSTEETTKLSSSTIALVNTDKGVAGEDGKIIYYAANLTQDMGDAYAVQNLEAARSGVESGKFAAYVIIPTTFSESVVSLNANPNRAKIEYCISNEVDEESKQNALLSIHQFERNLNNDMSYMYISTILSNFHEAQDAANTVMENDTKEKETLLAIQPLDLVEMIAIPQLSIVDTSVAPLEVSSYNENNVSAIEQINESYKYFISLSAGEVEALKQSGLGLVTDFTRMENTIGTINLLKDDTGTPVYETGINNLVTSIGANNSDYQNKETEIDNYLNDVIAKTTDSKDKLNTVMNDYNDNLELVIKPGVTTALYQTLEPYFKSVQTPAVLDDAYYTASAVNSWAEMQDYITNLETLIANAADLGTFRQAYSGLKASSGFDNEITAIINGSARLEDMFGIDTAYLQTELVSRQAGQIDADRAVIEAAIDNELAAIPPFSDIYNTATGDTVRDLLDSQIAEAQRQQNNGLQNISRLDEDAIKNTINEEIISPISARSQSEKSRLIGEYEQQKTALSTYNGAVQSYDPLANIDNSVINGHITGMNTNNSEMHSLVSDNYAANMTYVSDVIKNAEENVSVLQKNITEAKEASDNAVADGLAAVHNLKTETSSTNQALMSDFTKKLPYTRLGKLENTTTYQFIADPILLNNLSELDFNTTPVTETGSIGVQTTREKKNASWIFFVISGAAIVIMGIAAYVVSHQSKIKKNREVR